MDLQEILKRGFDEYAEFVNPLITNRARLAGEPIRVVKTDAGRIVDADGTAFEDFHGTQQFGHRHPHITNAVIGYLQTPQVSWYPSRVSPQAGRLAKLLCQRSGVYDNAWFGMSGADVVEAAIKLARVATKKTRILGLRGGYHGCSMGACSLMEQGPFHDPFGPHLPGVEALPFGDIDALHRACTAGDVAALIIEPIQGEGGVRVLPDAWVAAACELTGKHGALLIADEVQTGFGRTGRFLRTELWPRRPDAVLMAKAIGGGLAPVSAMLTKRAIFERAYGQDFEDGESHNLTFSYNALGMVAGIAAVELLTDDLLAGVAEKGAHLERELRRALEGHPLLLEHRGEGLMRGVHLKSPDHPWLSFEHFGFTGLGNRSTISPLLCMRMFKQGFFCFTCGHDWSVFRIQPRFAVEKETLTRFADAVRSELDWLWNLTS